MAGMLGLAVLLGVATDTPLGRTLFYGALAAMSSTAVVTKSYADCGELDTPNGREVVSILVFQDLCIVPLILLLPLLGREEGATGISVWTRMLASLAVMTALVIGGRFAVRRVLDHIVGLRDRELFTLCVGFFGIATVLVTEAAGFSLAIGAFLAGLIISESEYGLQALSDVLPFRALFSGVLFTSIGMLLDLSFVLNQPLVLVAATLVLILVKSIVAAGAVLVRGSGLETSLMTGLSLAQVGEFSFVLAAVGLPLGLFAGDDYQGFLSVAALSMMATPFLIKSARPISESIGARLKGSVWKDYATDVEAAAAAGAAELTDHAVVVGYGVAGRYLARMLQAAGIACAVVDQDAELVRLARADGLPAVYGDGTRHAMLERVACTRARIIVFAISSPVEERRGVAVAREVAPAVQIVVRTRYVRAIDDLIRLGANQVVVEEFEASLELFARALESYAIPATRIAHELEAVRNEHYGLLRGTAAPDLTLDTLKHLGIHDALEIVEVEEGAAAVDENAQTLDLRHQTGAVQVAVVRDGQPIYQHDQTFRYRPGGTDVLVGDREALDRASALFRRT